MKTEVWMIIEEDLRLRRLRTEDWGLGLTNETKNERRFKTMIDWRLISEWRQKTEDYRLKRLRTKDWRLNLSI